MESMSLWERGDERSSMSSIRELLEKEKRVVSCRVIAGKGSRIVLGARSCVLVYRCLKVSGGSQGCIVNTPVFFVIITHTPISITHILEWPVVGLINW